MEDPMRERPLATSKPAAKIWNVHAKPEICLNFWEIAGTYRFNDDMSKLGGFNFDN
jgi:hypothetical protein